MSFWKTKIPKEFESNTSSASPVQAGDFLLVPISTYETIMAIDPSYECCKSSGGMVAINTKDGEIIWNHRIEQKAEYTKKGMITKITIFFNYFWNITSRPSYVYIHEL